MMFPTRDLSNPEKAARRMWKNPLLYCAKKKMKNQLSSKKKDFHQSREHLWVSLRPAPKLSHTCWKQSVISLHKHMASSNDNAILGKKVLFVYVINFPFTKLWSENSPDVLM
jgi:hypothetical protein